MYVREERKEYSLIMNDLLLETIENKKIEDCIFEIRGMQVILDSDVAYFYEIETRKLNQQMKRNTERFPDDFCFQLNSKEFTFLKSQNVTSSSSWGGTRKMPYVYTEQGIMALSGVIKNDIAVQMSIKIVRTFISMRKFIFENSDTLLELARLQNRQINFEIETNNRFNEVIKLIDKKELPKQTIFYDGQYYDAYEFISELIRKAKESIILIDPYMDNRALTFLKNKKENVTIFLYKSSKSKLSNEDISIFEAEYGRINVAAIDTFHDRFLIIDKEECYSLGTSLNHAGKRTFGINKIIDIDMIKTLIGKLYL